VVLLALSRGQSQCYGESFAVLAGLERALGAVNGGQPGGDVVQCHAVAVAGAFRGLRQRVADQQVEAIAAQFRLNADGATSGQWLDAVVDGVFQQGLECQWWYWDVIRLRGQ